MVRLDVGCAVATAGFNDIRVERALHEELDFLAAGAGLFEYLTLGLFKRANELLADDLALTFRLGDALQRLEEVIGRVHGDELDAGDGHEVMLDLLDLALAQQTVIHEHAGELVSNGLVYQSGGNGRIHTTRQTADYFGIADLLADFLDLVLNNGGGIPIVGQRGAAVQEVLDELLAERRMLDFRMPLHAIQLAGLIGHGGNRCAFGMREHREA